MTRHHITTTEDATATAVDRAHLAIQELNARDSAEREARVQRLARWTGDVTLARAQEAVATDAID
jgi:hypothetical protein